MSRVAIISDLHLTSDRRNSEFTHSESDFVVFLDALEAAHDEIFVVGDTYNLHHSQVPGPIGRRLELRAAQRRFPAITSRLHRAPFSMVYGNHDRELARLGVPAKRVVQRDGRKLVVTHGDQFDGFIKRLPLIASTGSWLEAWVRRLGLESVGERLVDIGRAANKLDPRRKLNATARAEAELPWLFACGWELLEGHDADVVILGHSHAPAVHRFDDGRLYVNGGSCAFGVWSWASLNLETLACGIGHWDPSRSSATQMASPP